MPIYRLNSTGTWKKLKVYRLDSTGVWKKLTGYRLDQYGVWKKIFGDLGNAPVAQSTPELTQSLNASSLAVLTGRVYHWTNNPTTVEYQFQYSFNNGSTWNEFPTVGWQTMTNPTSGSSTTINQTIDQAYVLANNLNKYRFRTRATNAAGTTLETAVNIAEVQGPTNITVTAGTATGNTVALSWTASTGANSYIVYYGTTSSPTTVFTTTTSTSATVTGLSSSTLYYFRVKPFTGSSGNGYEGNFSADVTATTLANPSGSGLTRTDSTVTPSQPSVLTFQTNTPSNNQVTTSWTNGSPITSVQFQASGAGANTSYGGSIFTSDTTSISSSGTYSATVTNFNNNVQVNVSWNQSNSQSYRINYNSSTLGADVVNGNNSNSSVSVDIPWSAAAGAFSLTSVNLYSGLNQTGTSVSLGGVAGTITPTQKSSSRSGSVAVTYIPPAPVNTSIPTLSPTSIFVGTLLTAGVGTWSNSPTSYDIRIYRGTAGVLTSETLVASGSGTTLTYTITQADYDSGQRYFRTYVNASNAGGSSGFVAGQERGPTQLPNVAPSGGTASIALTSGSGYPGSVYTLSKVDATGTPTPTASWIWRRANGGTGGNSFTGGSIIQTGGTTYTATTSDAGYAIRAEVTWSNGVSPNQVVNTNSLVVSAYTVPGTVSNLSASSLLSGTNLNWSASWSAPSNTGGQFITGYRVYVERGSSSTGPWTATATQIPAGTTSPTYTAASPYSTSSTSVSGRVTSTSSTWIRVYVAAVNASGPGSYTTAVG